MTNSAPAQEKFGSPAVERALAVLHLLTDHSDGLGVSEMSRALGEAKSSLHAVLATLERRGFVIKHGQTKRYQLGPQVLVIGAAYTRQTNLLNAFQSVAADLGQRCGETVQLAVLHGRYILYIGKHEGRHHIRLAAEIGSQLPAHATALGKALLNGLTDAAIDQLYGNVALERLTERTIDTVADLKRELALVAERGYATDRGEVSPDLRCVAAPVRDASGAIVAAISVSVPITRMNDQREAELAYLVLDAAAVVSRRLGHAANTTNRATA